MQNPSQLLAAFQQYQRENPFHFDPPELYRPVDYIFQLGGKSLRPQLVLLGCFLFDKAVKKALPAAYAVEIFHNFSLVHDDIMDKATLRRGKPTVHKKFGVNSAILSGDVMLIHAFRQIALINEPAVFKQLNEVFIKTAIEVCEGQQMDMNFEKRKSVTLAEYLKMIELKTAVLLGAALKMGAIVGGATAADAENLYHFGVKMGVAFQIQDDLLDAFGDPEKFGKKPGGDILQNKKTFLYLKALELADAATRKHLRQLYATRTSSDAKIAEVLAVFNSLNVKYHALSFQKNLQREAAEHLAQVSAAAPKKQLLFDWAEALIVREM
jgi:geranylgeranyl diphosphate synthase type II